MLFLVVPTIVVFSKALFDEQGNFGLEALKDAFTGQNLDAFKFSVKLSALAAAVGVVAGALLAYAAASIRRPKWLRSLVSAFSGVAANLGGVPLAFAFIALLGRQGLTTKILEGLGYDLYDTGFQLDTTVGFVMVYSYFNIPLMVLITLPAIDGLKASWREACANLGGTTFTYWRRIGLPVLAPSLLGGFLLLFANSFSAYATAAAMTEKSTDRPTADPVLPERRLCRSGPIGLLARRLDDPHHGGLDGPVLDAAQDGPSDGSRRSNGPQHDGRRRRARQRSRRRRAGRLGAPSPRFRSVWDRSPSSSSVGCSSSSR